MLIKYILTQKNPLFKHFCVLNDNVFHILFLKKRIGGATYEKVAYALRADPLGLLAFGMRRRREKCGLHNGRYRM
jgi:hypothetical protein